MEQEFKNLLNELSIEIINAAGSDRIKLMELKYTVIRELDYVKRRESEMDCYNPCVAVNQTCNEVCNDTCNDTYNGNLELEPRVYTESELVKFGGYLLSESRYNSIMQAATESFRFVHDADLCNWKKTNK